MAVIYKKKRGGCQRKKGVELGNRHPKEPNYPITGRKVPTRCLAIRGLPESTKGSSAQQAPGSSESPSFGAIRVELAGV